VDTEKGFRIEVGAPGIAKEDFKVDVNKDNVLTISVEKKIKTDIFKHKVSVFFKKFY